MTISGDPALNRLGQPSNQLTGFMPALLRALAAGGLSGAVLGALASFSLSISVSPLGDAVSQTLFAFLAMGAASVLISIFPLGPLAWLTFRTAYRRGLRSLWSLGLVGALTAASVPLAFSFFYPFLVAMGTPQPRDATSEVVVIAIVGSLWFGISGAVGGVVFARIMRQRDFTSLRDAASSF
jgi:hypothetical protein